ncbi:MAG: hypothetical protein DWQ44_13865 [Bacteroidetes bacterium]|nr:MAG: hypothetical protein DWQ33_03225 [Bacteroidota bacterium]REK07249.1 MAG: hypothetical protein DWQ39_01820 [Bacteroidota bacterium]REK31764.1 MAG: hypothetical protein DWQ44_13865 [Bacteroidota bacterium]REK48056.1 MAG: hypothetical protein DWQ48_11275 [Bacteroidota bacterium]
MKFFGKTLDAESRTLFRNSSWVFFSNFFSTGLAFLRSIIIARGLGVTIFGNYAVVVAFVGLIQEFLNLNIGTALIRYGAIYQSEKRYDKLTALVRLSVYASLAMAVVSVIIVAVLSRFSYSTFFTEPGLEWFIVGFAAAASITYVNSISRGLLRLHYKFRLSSVIQMIMDVIETLAIAIAVFFFPKDLSIFFTAVILTRFINGFICNALAFWELKSQLLPANESKMELIKPDVRDFRSYVLGNSLGNTLKTLISQGDIVLLRVFASVEQVGFYSVAKKLAYSVLTLSDPLVQSIFPQLSRLLAEKKYPEMRAMLRRITSITILPSIAFLIAAIFLSELIMGIVYGKEYLPAALSFNYFVVGAVLASITFWMLPLVQSLGLIRERLNVYFVTILAGIVLSYLIVPSLQAQGMAMVLLLVNILNLALFGLMADRRMKTIESHLS